MLTGDLFQPLTEKKKKPKPTNPDKWAYAKSEAKKKFDVYPSAYANAWAAKKYKALGGGWRMGEDAVEEEQLNELDMWAPHTAYIKTAPGVYFKADWRQSEKLTGDDATSFIKVQPLQPQVVKSMGLDAKLNDKSATRYRNRELARGGPIGASGPLADREITLVDLTDRTAEEFGAPQLPNGVQAELYKFIEKQGVAEAEDQKSNAGERAINDQVYVNLMRKAQELPVTGLNRDERIKLALAKGVNKALDDTKKLQQATDSLERELVDIEDEHGQAAQGVDVKQAPAAKSEVQKTFNSVAASVNQAIQQTEDPKQRQELQREAERIKSLVRTAKLSNADVQKINKEVKAKGKNGFTAQELQRITDTIAQQAQQTKQEKTAAQQTQAVQQVAQPDPAQLKAVVDTEVKQELQKELEPIKRELNSIKTQRFTQQAKQASLYGVDDAESAQDQKQQAQGDAAIRQIATQAPRIGAGLSDIEYRTAADDSNVLQLKKAGNLREANEETFDFRLPAARVVGVVDDLFAADWNKVYQQFEKDYYDESGSDDPSEEAPTQLQKAFYYPQLIVKKLSTLSSGIDDLVDYHTQIYNSQDYKAMFGQVMFPAFQGKIYGGTVRSKETEQDFNNDYEFFIKYKQLIALVIRDEVHPFMRNVNNFIKAVYAENTQDNHAMYKWYSDNILSPYKKLIDKINVGLQGVDRVAKQMFAVLPKGNQTQGQLIERKKKKKSKSKKSFGGYYYPGYHYYGQDTAEVSDGGGDGGGESMFEVVIKNRTPEETGSLDSYYSRRRQPHKVVDGKRVELTDKEEIQQYMDAYENQTDRKDYGDLSEQRLYFRTVATLAESLEQDFGMQKDDKGWYLTARSGRQRILDAERAFGEPRIL